MSVSDEEPYSTIFASLRHPIRRRILRMLFKKPMSFSEILEVLGVSSSFLTYHLENLGELVGKIDDNKYRLSSFGEAAIATMTKVEDIPTTAFKMSETKPSETKPKKMVSRSIAIALGIICIILAVSLVGAFAYYMPMINDRDNTISSLDSQLSNLDGNFSNYRLLKDFTVVASNQTVTPLNNYTGGYVGYGFDFSVLYSGYVSVTVNDSTENPTIVRLICYSLGYPFEYELEIPTGGTSYFPVTGSPEPSGPIAVTTGFIIILFKNPSHVYDEATVTIVYYY